MYKKIVINEETCIGCGACSKVCSKKILVTNNKKVKVLNYDDWKCSECGLCMSVCPNKSINIEGLDYDNFSELPENKITYSALKDMLSSRRSIRSFNEKPIEKDIINKIIEASAMAPIGAPPTNVKVLVLNNRKDLDVLYESIVTDWKKVIRSMKNPIFRFISKKVTGDSKYNALIKHGLPAAIIYCDYADDGRNVFTFNASSIIIFYGEKLGVCINENCWLSCSYGTIAAHSLGLGGTLSGMIPPIINMNKDIKLQLGIPEKDDVFACLMLGHPDKKIKFIRKIPREFKKIDIL